MRRIILSALEINDKYSYAYANLFRLYEKKITSIN